MITKLGVMMFGDEAVTFYEPPHPEPDFPWVDVRQLARVYIGDEGAAVAVENSKEYKDGKAVVTFRDGDTSITIISHSMAQGLCEALDEIGGWKGDPELGPTFKQYVKAAAMIEVRYGSLSTFVDVKDAYKNSGGPFLRDDEDKGTLQ